MKKTYEAVDRALIDQHSFKAKFFNYQPTAQDELDWLKTNHTWPTPAAGTIAPQATSNSGTGGAATKTEAAAPGTAAPAKSETTPAIPPDAAQRYTTYLQAHGYPITPQNLKSMYNQEQAKTKQQSSPF